jgi:hypothetical protein
MLMLLNKRIVWVLDQTAIDAQLTDTNIDSSAGNRVNAI